MLQEEFTKILEEVNAKDPKNLNRESAWKSAEKAYKKHHGTYKDAKYRKSDLGFLEECSRLKRELIESNPKSDHGASSSDCLGIDKENATADGTPQNNRKVQDDELMDVSMEDNSKSADEPQKRQLINEFAATTSKKNHEGLKRENDGGSFANEPPMKKCLKESNKFERITF